jgi:small-conductance mechanosensitive channel
VRRSGYPRARNDRLGQAINSNPNPVILARAERSFEPFDLMATEQLGAIAAAIYTQRVRLRRPPPANSAQASASVLQLGMSEAMREPLGRLDGAKSKPLIEMILWLRRALLNLRNGATGETRKMPDLVSFAETAVRDPLVGGFVIIAVGALVNRLLLRRHPRWRAVVRVVFLILLTGLLLQGGVVPYQPQQPSGMPVRDDVINILKIAWWLWAAWLLVGLVHSFVVFENRPREGKLVRDLLAGLIYLAAAFAIIAYVFDLPVQGLLATSGVVAIVLGLALQSTLNDVFSGLVLSLSRPARPGDWINVDGSTEGEVVEINWRATHVLTPHHDLAIVSNSTIAKSKIVNLTLPSGTHGIAVTIRLACSPAVGMPLLQSALLNSRSILATPQPSIRVVSIEAACTEFELTAFVERRGSMTHAQNELFDLAYRHVSAAGIRFAPSKDQPLQAGANAESKIERRDPQSVLDIVPLFVTLSFDERAAIAKKLKVASYEKGDLVVEAGTVLQSLFIVGRGVLSVTGKSSVGEIEVLRFGPGDHYGEIGLLSGAAAGANVRALAHAIVYELAKADLSPILEARPQIADELSYAFAQQQATGRALTLAGLDTNTSHPGLSGWFSERIRKLFEPVVLK